jgi:hypothetical protein
MPKGTPGALPLAIRTAVAPILESASNRSWTVGVSTAKAYRSHGCFRD